MRLRTKQKVISLDVLYTAPQQVKFTKQKGYISESEPYIYTALVKALALSIICHVIRNTPFCFVNLPKFKQSSKANGRKSSYALFPLEKNLYRVNHIIRPFLYLFFIKFVKKNYTIGCRIKKTVLECIKNKNLIILKFLSSYALFSGTAESTVI